MRGEWRNEKIRGDARYDAMQHLPEENSGMQKEVRKNQEEPNSDRH